MKRVTLAVLISAATLLSYCSGDKDETLNPGGNACDGVNANFAAHVQPILATSCATNSACHGEGFKVPSLQEECQRMAHLLLHKRTRSIAG
jgi:hypothetical protein